LRINEISMVDRGAGENCRIVISKRNDSDDSNTELSVEERARAKMEGRRALRDAEDIERRKREGGDEDRRYYDLLTGRTTTAELYGVDKSFAATARGDEADLQDEQTSADELVDGGGNSHHVSRIADLLVESGKHPDRQSALDHLLHTAHGAAILQRLSKQHHEDTPPMSLNLSEVVKAHGIGALCRHMIKSASSFGVDEHQLVKLATEDAQRKYPGDTPAIAFTKLYTDSSELREAIEIAKGASLQDAVSAELEKDAHEAMEELTKIGKARWPGLTPAQRFARAFETNPELARRAHRRPGPSTSFPQPVTKMPERASLEPRVADETNVGDPAEALAQLRQLGRDRWPNESEAQQFLNAMTTAEYGDLIRRALGRPTESSPPRR
jgi:hypothetical protein